MTKESSTPPQSPPHQPVITLDYAPQAQRRPIWKILLRPFRAFFESMAGVSPLIIGAFLGGFGAVTCFWTERLAFGVAGFGAACLLAPLAAAAIRPVRPAWWWRWLGILIGLILALIFTEEAGDRFGEPFRTATAFALSNARLLVWCFILGASLLDGLLVGFFNTPRRRIAVVSFAMFACAVFALGTYAMRPRHPDVIIQSPGTIETLRISHDGRFCVTTESDFAMKEPYSARVWDTDTGQQVQFVPGCKSAVLLPDGRRMIAYRSRGKIQLLDVRTSSEILVFETTMEPRDSKLPIGSPVTSGWPTPASPAPVSFFPVDSDPYESRSFTVSADGTRLLARVKLEDKSARAVWSIASGKLIALLPDPIDHVTFDSWLSADGRRALCGDTVWDVDGKFVLAKFNSMDRPLGLSEDGTIVMFASGDRRGHLEAWSVETNAMVRVYEIPAGSVDISADFKTVAVWPDRSSDVLISDLETGVEAGHFREGLPPSSRPLYPMDPLCSIELSPTGTHMATFNLFPSSNKIRIWRLPGSRKNPG